MRRGIAIVFGVWLVCGILSLVTHFWILGIIPTIVLVFYIIKGLMVLDEQGPDRPEGR